MVRSLMALVLRRVLSCFVRSREHAKDLEIVVLRHQLQVLRRHVGRPRFRWSDRLFLSAASCHLARETWRAFLVTPQTVLRWHRELVRRKWSRGAGRVVQADRSIRSGRLRPSAVAELDGGPAVDSVERGSDCGLTVSPGTTPAAARALGEDQLEGLEGEREL